MMKNKEAYVNKIWFVNKETGNQSKIIDLKPDLTKPPQRLEIFDDNVRVYENDEKFKILEYCQKK